MKKISLNRALAAKKKFYLALLSALLLSSAAMADDVLFKMIMTAGSGISVTRQTETPIADNMAFIIGGSALIYDNSTGDPQTLFGKSGNSYCRIVSSNIFIKVTLDRALQAGDVISYKAAMTDARLGDNIVVCRQFEVDGVTPKRGSLKVYMDGTANPSYTVSSNDDLVGQTDFYIWLGNVGKNSSNQNNYSFITSFTITRSSNLVKFYSFESLTSTDFTSNTTSGNVIVDGELYLNSDGTASGSSCNGIKASTNGKPQSLYSRGEAENRALMLNVTDPCTVEIWAWSSQKNLGINEGKYAASSATTIITGNAVDANVIQKGTYNYTGLEDLKTLYTTVNGGVNIAAIRVTYTKIRPVADLAITPTSLTVRTAQKENFTISTSSNVTIKRDKTTNTADVKFDGITTYLSTPSGEVTGTVEGKTTGTYVMTLTQPASADYRKGYAELTITVANEVERNEMIGNTTGTLTLYDPNDASKGGVEWNSTTGNITLIATTSGDNRIRVPSVSPNPGDQYLLFANDIKYRISVPANKQIKSVTISGFSNTSKDANTSYITEQAEPRTTFPSYKNDDVVAGSVTFSDVNSTYFEFTCEGGVIAVINLTVEESNAYPLTISNGWASFYCPEFVQLPDGLTAYKAVSSDGSEILLEEVSGQVVRESRGVVIAADADGIYDLTAISNPGDSNYENFSSAFSGTSKRTALPSGTIYCLNSAEGEFQQYEGTYIPANKAYYKVATPKAGAPARFGMRIVQRENTTTAIENTEFVPIDYSAPIYNLQGLQVQVTESGIYIQNGRKYLIMK